jgi:hypothetical protein
VQIKQSVTEASDTVGKKSVNIIQFQTNLDITATHRINYVQKNKLLHYSNIFQALQLMFGQVQALKKLT